jgi:hypothetical protein
MRTALCKIPVEVGYSGLVRSSTGGSSFDHMECGVRSLHLLRLELKDTNGNLLDLQGTAFSMTLRFSEDSRNSDPTTDLCSHGACYRDSAPRP